MNMKDMWQHHQSGGRQLAAVRPGTTLDAIRYTGNELFLWFEHGNEMVHTSVPEHLGNLEIVDLYTMKHEGPTTEADDALDRVEWSFVCENGHTWTAQILVEPWFTSPRQRKPRAFAVGGHIWRGAGSTRVAHFGVCHVEID
jgi:hypothetical protein